MHASIYHQRRRLVVALVGNHREGKAHLHDYYGQLGAVVCEPAISEAERLRFWRELPARFRAIQARHPAVTPEQIAKVKAKIAARIPRPAKAGTPASLFQEIAARREPAEPKRSKGVRVPA